MEYQQCNLFKVLNTLKLFFFLGYQEKFSIPKHFAIIDNKKMKSTDSDDKKIHYTNTDFVRKCRHFSPKMSTLIVLNILALARKVAAVHNWNDSTYNTSLSSYVNGSIINPVRYNISFKDTFQEVAFNQLSELFQGVNAYGRNHVGKILEEEQDALSNEPLEGFKVLNYDELNKLIDGIVTISSSQTPLITTAITTFEAITTNVNSTSTTFYHSILGTTATGIASIYDPNTSIAYFTTTELPTLTRSTIADSTPSSSKQSRLSAFKPAKTVDTPPWLLDSSSSIATFATTSSAAKSTLTTKTGIFKNKPVFLRAKKFSNKNKAENTNTTIDANNRSVVGLNDIFENKGSVIKNTFRMVFVLSISYLFIQQYV